LTPWFGLVNANTNLFDERNTNPVIRRDDIGLRSETVRRANLSAIVRELHVHGPQSRSELVARTGLTRSAIRGLIGELVAADLVDEERAVPLGVPGRPSPVVHPSSERRVVLALEIAVDSLAAATVGLGGSVLQHRRVDRPMGHTSVEQIVDDLVQLADALGISRPPADEIAGIGVAVVGIVRREDGYVVLAPNLGWRDEPLGARLRDAFGGRIPVDVSNDADLGALAEWRRGAAVGVDNVLFLAGEVGVGGGMIVDGSPVIGVAGYGGEVGHIPVDPDGVDCRCGSVGCWETVIGEGRLLTLAGYPADGGASAVEAVLREADAGDPRARAALEQVAKWLGFGLAGLVNVLDPGLIVLGGRFERLYPYVIDRVEAQLDRLALPASRALIRIVPATLGDTAVLLGAAELAFEPLLADPAAWLGPREPLAELASA
jgi:predicted NBD/HSP70 family sugar kinase